MYFRTKFIKGTALVQLVESYRNAEGLPRQRNGETPPELTLLPALLGDELK